MTSSYYNAYIDRSISVFSSITSTYNALAAIIWEDFLKERYIDMKETTKLNVNKLIGKKFFIGRTIYIAYRSLKYYLLLQQNLYSIEAGPLKTCNELCKIPNCTDLKILWNYTLFLMWLIHFFQWLCVKISQSGSCCIVCVVWVRAISI